MLLILIDYGFYKKTKSKTSFSSIILGIVLIIPNFFANGLLLTFTSINANPKFGSTDLIPLLFGVTILFYGLPNLKKFVVPLGIAISFVVIAWFPTTSFGDKVHDYFASLTVSATKNILNFFHYPATSVRDTITLINSKFGRQTVIVSRGCFVALKEQFTVH